MYRQTLMWYSLATMSKKQQAQAVLKRLIRQSGSKSALARKLGLHKTAMTNWLREGVVPVTSLSDVQRVFNLDPHEVRPDLFRPPKIGDKNEQNKNNAVSSSLSSGGEDVLAA